MLKLFGPSNKVEIIIIFLLLGTVSFVVFVTSHVVLQYSPKATFMLLASVVIVFIVILDPLKGLFLVLILTPIYNPYLREIGIRGAMVNNVLILLVFIGFFVKVLANKNFYLIRTPVDLPIIFLVILVSINLTRSISYFGARRRILSIGLLLVPFFLIAYSIKSKKQLKSLIDVVIVSTLIGSIYGIYTGAFRPFYGVIYRAYGAFRNPNGLASFLILVIPIAIARYIIEKDFLKKAFIAFTIVVAVACVLYTQSRSSWIGLMISIMVITYFTKRKVFIAFIILVALTFIITIPSLSERAKSLLDFKDNALAARILLWKQAINYFEKHPLIGIGTANYYGSAIPYNSKPFDVSFNIFLTFAAEYGILGPFFLLWIFFALISEAYKIYTLKNISPFYKYLSLSIMGILVGNMIQGLFEDTLLSIMSNWMFGMIAGFVPVINHLIIKEYKIKKWLYEKENSRKLLQST